MTLDEAKAECIRDTNAKGILYEAVTTDSSLPSPQAAIPIAAVSSAATPSIASCSTAIRAKDTLLESASLLVAQKESILSEQRMEFIRKKRDELDRGVVDVETLVANVREASRLAKEAHPDNPQLEALRSALDRKRDLERQLAETDTEIETILNTLTNADSATGKRHRTG